MKNSTNLTPDAISGAVILVTGGAGFIGSHVNKLLRDSGCKTIVYDDLSANSSGSVVTPLFVEGDIGDEERLSKLFKTHQIDFVMHFAGSIDVGESFERPLYYYQNNTAKTLQLLKVMRAHQVDKILFSSTAAIFGRPIRDKIDEKHPFNPISPYGRSKLYIEQILEDCRKCYGLNYCIFRYFNAAGGDPTGEIKNCKRREVNLIPIILRNIKNHNTPSQINGTDYPTRDGTCVRDYIHVMDIANAHLMGLHHLLMGNRSSSFNLGGSCGYSIREIFTAVERVTGVKPNVVEQSRRRGDPHTLIADYTKAKRELEWCPKFSLEEMIEHAWRALAD